MFDPWRDEREEHERLIERVRWAAGELDSHFEQLRTVSRDRRDWLASRGIPLVAFVGPSRCGKDYACRTVADRFDLRFNGTTSQVMCPLVAKVLDLTEGDAYRTRHQYRQAWRNIIDLFRADNPAKVVELNFGISDVIAGVRPTVELEAAKEAGMIEFVIWIENPRCKTDETLEFDANHPGIDLTVVNKGDERFVDVVCNVFGHAMKLGELT